MKYEELPKAMQEGAIKPYWDLLQKKKGSLILKRLMDIVASFLMLVILSPFLLILAAAVKLDSKGPVFYRQVRVGRYNQDFKIFKFRTMVQNADLPRSCCHDRGRSANYPCREVHPPLAAG